MDFLSSRSRYLALFKWIEMLIVYIHTYCCRLKEGGKKEQKEWKECALMYFLCERVRV